MKPNKNQKSVINQEPTVFDRVIASPKGVRVIAVIAILSGVGIFCPAAGNTTSSRAWGWIGGGFLCLLGIFLLWFARARENEAVNEELRCAAVAETVTANGGRSPALRPADTTAKCRVFLQIKKGGLDICYRRVKRTNELVVNGSVYDEITALLEFDHRLVAVLDGHTVEAGYSEECSYIKLDGKLLAKKQRFY